MEVITSSSSGEQKKQRICGPVFFQHFGTKCILQKKHKLLGSSVFVAVLGWQNNCLNFIVVGLLNTIFFFSFFGGGGAGGARVFRFV